jgi:lincosamide and streptogramin A transport system ATP-binding/permease protein
VADLCRAGGADQTAVKTMLSCLGFGRDDMGLSFSEMSQGQWRKLLMAMSLSKPAHLYLWDEPLDHIDIFSRAQIEDMILESGPSLVVIEHELAFLEKVSTRTVDLGGR